MAGTVLIETGESVIKGRVSQLGPHASYNANHSISISSDKYDIRILQVVMYITVTRIQSDTAGL